MGDHFVAPVRDERFVPWQGVLDYADDRQVGRHDGGGERVGEQGGRVPRGFFSKELTKPKLLTSKYNGYAKSSTLPKLAALQPYLGGWVASLQSRGLQPHVSLQLLRLSFYSAGANDTSISGRFQIIVCGGLDQWLQDVP